MTIVYRVPFAFFCSRILQIVAFRMFDHVRYFRNYTYSGSKD